MGTTKREGAARKADHPARDSADLTRLEDVSRRFEELAAEIAKSRPFDPSWEALSELEILEEATALTKREK
jgi:hypothetical protein